MTILAVNSELLTNGAMVALFGYLVVFMALVSMYFIFSLIPYILRLRKIITLRKKGVEDCPECVDDISGDVNAAMSAALYLYFNEMHDDESNVITIKKVSRTYSPWSSRIYGMRNFNRSFNK